MTAQAMAPAWGETIRRLEVWAWAARAGIKPEGTPSTRAATRAMYLTVQFIDMGKHPMNVMVDRCGGIVFYEDLGSTVLQYRVAENGSVGRYDTAKHVENPQRFDVCRALP